mmetsp:Transcript_35777/g.106792  ORF Transcript_35777/g.106792 Transcript_35777/m.106792 type:complete len:256 (-) Transcript_35777:1616-2383(-)
MLQKPSCHSMPGLVVRHNVPFFFRYELVGLQSTNDSIRGRLEIFHGDCVSLASCRNNGGLVAYVGNVSSSEARCQSRKSAGEVPCLSFQSDVLQVDQENLLPALQVRLVNLNLPVEPPRSSECLVENVYAVGAGEYDHIARGREAVHLDEELIESVLALIVAARHSATTALPADGVDLVDEDYAGRIAPRFLEEVPDARWTDAHEHFNEVGSGDTVERDAGLTSHSLSQEGLAGARGTAQKGTLGNFGPQLSEAG